LRTRGDLEEIQRREPGWEVEVRAYRALVEGELKLSCCCKNVNVSSIRVLEHQRDCHHILVLVQDVCKE
jgi:hypothetical protein